jgi:hypothetical protein
MQYSNDGERGHDLPGNLAWPNVFHRSSPGGRSEDGGARALVPRLYWCVMLTSWICSWLPLTVCSLTSPTPAT